METDQSSTRPYPNVLSRDDEVDARKWLMRKLSDGVPVEKLHELVDSVAHGVLTNAVYGQRKERQRADRAEVERDELRAELDQLRERVEALRLPRTTSTNAP